MGAISVLGVNLDLSKVTDKPFEKLENVLDDKKLKKTIEYLNSGAIICFDDFERKSKDIDLNDLFGFITQLTLNFDCKVVIILNDDVFEGEEKKIFSNVKEKSVSKFLKYEPSIKELFETIFSMERYRVLDTHKDIILNTIEETGELNARIYIQVLDNLVEWIDKKQEINDDVLRCLILVNINFILYHTVLYLEFEKIENNPTYKYKIHMLVENDFVFSKDNFYNKNNGSPIIYSFEKYISNIKAKETGYSGIGDERMRILNNFIDNNRDLFKSEYFANKFDISKNLKFKTFQKINNFIESGILINE